MMRATLRTLVASALVLPLDCLVAGSILAADALSSPLRLRHTRPPDVPPADISSVTIQILNWDGKHLLEECLPSVVAAVRRHEAVAGAKCTILVVDNGSHDGSVEYLNSHFPEVRVVRLDRNYGFAIGNNRGFQHVSSDIVILLNNDMLVDPGFIAPLLEPFSDNAVFAVTSQIAFADTSRRREETGKTRARYERGFFYLWHDDIRPEDERQRMIPVFWAGGGSCAIDRRKLQALGGFDSLYHPFYVEDTDLSYQAWKRGWKSMLAPASAVVHKHRGTSRPRFGDDFVNATIRRNQYLFVWKNVTDFGMIARHLIHLPRIHGRAIAQNGARAELRAYTGAFLRLPLALWKRARNLPACAIGDAEVLKYSQ